MILFNRLPEEISASSTSVSSVKYFFSVRILFMVCLRLWSSRIPVCRALGDYLLPVGFLLVKIPFLGLPREVSSWS